MMGTYGKDMLRHLWWGCRTRWRQGLLVLGCLVLGMGGAGVVIWWSLIVWQSTFAPHALPVERVIPTFWGMGNFFFLGWLAVRELRTLLGMVYTWWQGRQDSHIWMDWQWWRSTLLDVGMGSLALLTIGGLVAVGGVWVANMFAAAHLLGLGDSAVWRGIIWSLYGWWLGVWGLGSLLWWSWRRMVTWVTLPHVSDGTPLEATASESARDTSPMPPESAVSLHAQVDVVPAVAGMVPMVLSPTEPLVIQRLHHILVETYQLYLSYRQLGDLLSDYQGLGMVLQCPTPDTHACHAAVRVALLHQLGLPPCPSDAAPYQSEYRQLVETRARALGYQVG